LLYLFESNESTPIDFIVFCCRRNRLSLKNNCPFRVRIKECANGIFKAISFILCHNHGLMRDEQGSFLKVKRAQLDSDMEEHICLLADQNKSPLEIAQDVQKKINADHPDLPPIRVGFLFILFEH